MNGLNHFLVGCDCNRTTLDSIQAAGFEVSQLERTTLAKAPAFVRPRSREPQRHHFTGACAASEVEAMPRACVSLPALVKFPPG